MKLLFKIKLVGFLLLCSCCMVNAQVMPFGMMNTPSPSPGSTVKIGDLLADGVVFYIAEPPTDLDGDGNLDDGLVCALSDSTSSEWGCNTTDLSNVLNVGSSTDPGAYIGDGMSNTNNIINDCATSNAALSAQSYGLDWFLPSINELEEIFKNKDSLEVVSGVSPFSTNYWSSSEFNGTVAWAGQYSGSTFSSVSSDKALIYGVRAVKAFKNLKGTFSGATNILLGETSTLSNSTPWGVWSSSNKAVATIDRVTGIITTVSLGETTITYSVFEDNKMVSGGLIITVTNGLAVGVGFQGGVIAYISKLGDSLYDSNTQSGIIAATSDSDGTFPWFPANPGNVITDGCLACLSDSNFIGAGYDNTTIIQDFYVSEENTTNKSSSTYIFGILKSYTNSSYTDWLVPSLVELSKLYDSQDLIGGFDKTANYWTSNDEDSGNNTSTRAYVINFSNGSTGNPLKNNKNIKFRAIRYFSLNKPSAPTYVHSNAGNAMATILFGAPANDGGSDITGYTVTQITPTPSAGQVPVNGASSPITVTGLTNGIAYTFTVTATNAVGISIASASTSVTPAGAPDAPTIVTATAGNGSANVSFTAPSDGGSGITGYTVTQNTPIPSAGQVPVNGASSPITVTGLTNGTAYTFTVTATNANGIGAASSASISVIPSTVPGPPTIGTATATRGVSGEATVLFMAPTSNGFSPITSYTATSNPDGITSAVSQSGDGSITMTGLTDGTPYTFSVTATNANGIGAASSASISVIPSTVPGTPINVAAVAGNGSANVSFIAPSDGGSGITGYTVTQNTPIPSAGQVPVNGASSPITVTGLNNGTLYTFTVTATNANGIGAASAASSSVEPFSPPPEQVGDFYQGGVVFHFFVNGETGYVAGETHGLIAAVADQSSGIRWYNGSEVTTGARVTAVGTGATNTTKIINVQGATATSYAAGLARAYTGGEYNDWFLPSKDELNKMYLNRVKINTTALKNSGSNFTTSYYWSSTEIGFDGAWRQNFSNGNPYTSGKYRTDDVRAVRAF